MFWKCPRAVTHGRRAQRGCCCPSSGAWNCSDRSDPSACGLIPAKNGYPSPSAWARAFTLSSAGSSSLPLNLPIRAKEAPAFKNVPRKRQKKEKRRMKEVEHESLSCPDGGVEVARFLPATAQLSGLVSLPLWSVRTVFLPVCVLRLCVLLPPSVRPSVRKPARR